ncbi:MAG: hypothetical protein KIS94_00120 [Chitinophagales bacterium]|nr:hypothetical protein [Chitinophagales bacterium]
MLFKASLDKLGYAITALVFGIVAFVTYRIVAETGSVQTGGVIAIVALWLFILIVYLFRSVSYTINESSVIVHRVIKDIAIPKADIVEKKQIPSEDMTWTIRTFGVGGLFGYYGKFFNTKFGSMIWYATQRKNYVMLVTQGVKFVLTPNDPEKFLAVLG